VRVIAPAMVQHIEHFDVMLTTYNFTMAPEIGDAIHLAAAAGLGVVAMKVMAGGNKPGRMPNDGGKTKEILGKEGAMLAALRWALRNPDVRTTIPSITDADQLEENMKAMAAPLSPAEQQLLEVRSAGIRPFYCNMCNECAGTCAKGLPVADVLRFYMYSENYGEFGLGRDNFRQLPARLQSVRCGDCRECSVECPNGVRVMERLTRAQEMFA
jgi:predicted aldo/keto reductase-like oxidoreductase